MKKYLVVFLLISAVGFSQNLNEYKYAVVPAKFSFLKEENQYNLNLLSKLFLQKYGFEVYFDTDKDVPDDFLNTNCNKVYLDLIPKSTMFITKVTAVLKDCKGNVLATSNEGSSREKEYNVAYNQALRMAFDNFSVLKSHVYQPSQKSIEMIGEPSKPVIETKEEDVLQKDINFKKEPVTNQMFFKQYNVVATENGFNLITSASDYKIFQIFKTSSKDVFIANRDNVSGVLIKKTDNWFFEYYDENVLKSELIKVTF